MGIQARKGRPAAQVLTKPTSWRKVDILAIVVIAALRARIEDGREVELFVFVQTLGRSEFLAAQLLHPLLSCPFQIVDLNRQRSPHEVEQDLCDLAAHGGAGTNQCGMFIGLDVLGVADIIERLIADLQQLALLKVRRRDAPAPVQVAIEPIGQHVSQGTPGFSGRGEANLGITRVKLNRQVQGVKDLLRQTSRVMPSESAFLAAL